MSSLSLAGWAPAVTEAGEVRCPSLPPSWLSPKFLLQWQFFDHMGTFYKETIPPKMGFSPLDEARKAAVFTSYQALAFFSAVLGGVSPPEACGPVAQGGRSRPFPSWVKQNPLS